MWWHLCVGEAGSDMRGWAATRVETGESCPLETSFQSSDLSQMMRCLQCWWWHPPGNPALLKQDIVTTSCWLDFNTQKVLMLQFISKISRDSSRWWFNLTLNTEHCELESLRWSSVTRLELHPQIVTLARQDDRMLGLVDLSTKY